MKGSAEKGSAKKSGAAKTGQDRKRVWLGLGGNIGAVKEAMVAALQVLEEGGEMEVRRVSGLYKTPPWGVEDQPWFLNCCAEIETALSPLETLARCQEAERRGGRERNMRWGPRRIDIDVLVYEGCAQADGTLTLPHPRMMERAFVLTPLAEIAPELEVSGRTIADAARAADNAGIVSAGLLPAWRQFRGRGALEGQSDDGI